jgi:hypothetical protein
MRAQNNPKPSARRHMISGPAARPDFIRRHRRAKAQKKFSADLAFDDRSKARKHCVFLSGGFL